METKELVALLQALKDPNGKLSEKAENLKEKAIDVLTKRLEDQGDDDEGCHGDGQQEGDGSGGSQLVPGAKNLPF